VFVKGEWVAIHNVPAVVMRRMGTALTARFAGTRHAWIGYVHELRYASPDEIARGKELDGPDSGWSNDRTHGLAGPAPNAGDSPSPAPQP